MSATFVVSLDFELFWGMTGTVSFDAYSRNILNGRRAIPEVLKLFDKYGIHATWATVGYQFAMNRADLERFLPPDNLRPSYFDKTSDTYRILPMVGLNEDESPCFYSASLLSEISSHANQEIGSHTFSHYYCREAGQTTEQFRADMQAAKAIAQDKGYNIASVVFPRDMSTPEHVRVLKELGIQTFRDEADDWIHNKVRFRPLRRALTLLDVYFPLTGNAVPQPEILDGILRTVGNRQFRYYFKPLGFMEWAKVRRIKKQMLYAAKHGESYHLWWHPHNLGDHTESLLRQLDEIMSYYCFLNQKFGMQSVNMLELAQMMNSDSLE